MGNYNIGITAGVETTLAPQEFIQGGNQMDLIITPSEFTKETLVKTSYTHNITQDHRSLGVIAARG